MTRRAIRIGNASGFYGDRIAAMREMVEAGPLDVVTGDYLAELTMLIPWKARRKDPSAGYAKTFLTQLEGMLARAWPSNGTIVHLWHQGQAADTTLPCRSNVGQGLPVGSLGRGRDRRIPGKMSPG
jgi:hypothetical protein